MARAWVMAVVLGAWSISEAKPDPAGPLYYVAVHAVTDPAGGQGPQAQEVRRLFIAQLKRRADVTLDPPANLPTDAVAMKTELRRLGMRAYDASIKIQSVTKKVVRAPDGGRVLEMGVKLNIFGNTVPDRQLKIGGSGAAHTTERLKPNADPEAVATKVFADVADAAIKEAIEATVAKIEIVDPVRPVAK